MSGTGRINLEKGKVGSNVLGGYEKVSALVGGFGVIEGTGGKLEYEKPVKFRNLVEAESFGIASNKLLHHQMSEYFRVAGRGASLWVMNIQEPAAYEDIFYEEALKQLIAIADGEIFNIAIDYIPKSSQYVDGLNSEIFPAIKAAQAFADWTRQTNRPLHVVLAGADYNGASAATALDLRGLKNGAATIECPQVSLMIGQDYDFAETLAGREKKYACVGALLGAMAKQPVNYNVGEVETMSLTDARRGLWINAGLSNHKPAKEQESDLSTLNAKGYIFGEYYSGEVILNDDHNCTPVIVDADGNMNEHSISLSRTNAKVFRELYRIYLPKIKTTVPVDKQTGKLQIGMIKYFEGLGNNLFDNMEKRQELSGGATVVDPESNLLFGDKALNVSYNWVPTGSIGQINGIVNIKNSL